MPATLRVLESPSNDVWILARWLVDSEEDSVVVHRIQDAVRLQALRPEMPSYDQLVQPSTDPGPALFVDAINEMLVRNPLPSGERDLLAAWASFGLMRRPEGFVSDAHHECSEQVRRLWAERLPAKTREFKQGFLSSKKSRNGWSIPDAAVGNFGQDYALRARVALGGLGALEPAEAVYLTAATDASDQPLLGSHRYVVKIPPEGVPAKSFWSLTMYELMPDGRLFFVENDLNRFALGDRSPGLVKAADGSMSILLQRQVPLTNAERAAWLPAPAGEFRIVLRAYLPSLSLIAGEAKLPVVERLSG